MCVGATTADRQNGQASSQGGAVESSAPPVWLKKALERVPLNRKEHPHGRKSFGVFGEELSTGRNIIESEGPLRVENQGGDMDVPTIRYNTHGLDKQGRTIPEYRDAGGNPLFRKSIGKTTGVRSVKKGRVLDPGATSPSGRYEYNLHVLPKSVRQGLPSLGKNRLVGFPPWGKRIKRGSR